MPSPTQRLFTDPSPHRPQTFTRRQALVCLSALALTSCSQSNSPMASSDERNKSVSYYTCAMHPSVRSLDPHGKCPICGMDLIPVYGSTEMAPPQKMPPNASTMAPMPTPMPSDDSTPNMVNIPPDQLKAAGASSEVVVKRPLTRSLRAPARVTVDESSIRDINVKAGGGYITKLHANSIGLSFEKGQPLMTVLCENWLNIQIDYIKAYRNWKRTPSMTGNNYFALENQLELTRNRIRVWDLSEDQLHNLEKFALSTNDLDLKTGRGLSGSFDVLAPFDCYIHEKKAVEGMRFEAGQSLLQVADHHHAWIVAQFPESQASYVDIGQAVTVTFPSMPGHTLPGKIDFIDPHLDEDQRRISARIILKDQEKMIHPGLFAEVSAEIPSEEKLTISASAVLPTGNKYIVFIDHGKGKLEPRSVVLGARSGEYYPIISGLKEGDQVINGANFLIDSESRIQGILKTWGDQ